MWTRFGKTVKRNRGPAAINFGPDDGTRGYLRISERGRFGGIALSLRKNHVAKQSSLSCGIDDLRFSFAGAEPRDRLFVLVDDPLFRRGGGPVSLRNLSIGIRRTSGACAGHTIDIGWYYSTVKYRKVRELGKGS